MTGGRGGFWQEYIAAIVLAVLLGAAAASGAAGVLDAAFTRVMGDVLGPADEHTLIVHVRAEAAEDAARQIGTLLESLEAEAEGAAPGALAVRRGVSVAGNANFFVSIPERLVESAFLERMPKVLQQLPGFNGHTWLLEPGVTVAAPDGAVRDAAAKEAAVLPGVRAVVRHGSRFTVVARDEVARAEVARQLEKWLENHQVVDVRGLGEMTAEEARKLNETLQAQLAPQGWRVLEAGGEFDEAGPFAGALAALETLPDAWDRWTGAGADAEAALRQLVAAVDALEPFIAGAGEPDLQARRLSEALRAGDGADAVKDVLLRLAASALWQALTGEADSTAAAKDAGATASSPRADLLEQWQGVREMLAAAADGAARASEMPPADVEAISKAMDAIGELLPSRDPEGAGMTMLASRTSAGQVEELVRRALEDGVGAKGGPGTLSGVRAFVAEPGVIEPNPRAVLAGLLEDVRGAVAGILALLAAAAALFLDHAAVFAAWPRLPSVGSRAKMWAPAVGSLLFAGTYFLAGGAAPGASPGGPGGLELFFVALAGAGAGALALRLAPRISPVDDAELLAGLSLGLDDGQLLREIVVPRGRPGALTFLSEFRREFL